jgi:hypothetical protein
MKVLQEDEAEAAAQLRRWSMGFAFLQQLWRQMNNVVAHQGGLVPRKVPHKNRQRDAGTLLLHSDYLQMMQ